MKYSLHTYGKLKDPLRSYPTISHNQIIMYFLWVYHHLILKLIHHFLNFHSMFLNNHPCNRFLFLVSNIFIEAKSAKHLNHPCSHKYSMSKPLPQSCPSICFFFKSYDFLLFEQFSKNYRIIIISYSNLSLENVFEAVIFINDHCDLLKCLMVLSLSWLSY